MTTYIAEDIPGFRLTGEKPPAIMREEDFGLSEHTVARGEDEAKVRFEMYRHLLGTANFQSVIADGRQKACVAAANAIIDGVDLVQVGPRVYRIRKENRHGHNHG